MSTMTTYSGPAGAAEKSIAPAEMDQQPKRRGRPPRRASTEKREGPKGDDKGMEVVLLRKYVPAFYKLSHSDPWTENDMSEETGAFDVFYPENHPEGGETIILPKKDAVRAVNKGIARLADAFGEDDE